MKTIAVIYDSNHVPGSSKVLPGVKRLSRILALFISISFFLSYEPYAQNLDVPFVPTSEGVVEIMLDAVNVGPGDYVIDLGSGDGRIVIAAAKRGAVGHGIDIDPKRIKEARENAVKAGVDKKVLFIEDNIFSTDFSRASVVTMYLLNSVNLKLRPHLLAKLKPGTRLVSHDFDMDDWKPDKHFEEGYSDVYFWVIPANAGGTWKWDTGGKIFSMEVKQEFQEIKVKVTSGKNSYNTSDAVLSGERITFTVQNPANGESYVFSGRIDGDSVIGNVQVRNTSGSVIEQWNATRN